MRGDDDEREERDDLSPSNPDGDRQKLLGSSDSSRQRSDNDDDDDNDDGDDDDRYLPSRSSPIPFAGEEITSFRDREHGSSRLAMAVAIVLLVVILLAVLPSPLRGADDATPSKDQFAPSLTLVDLYSQMLRGCAGGACADMLGWDNSPGTRVQSVVVENSPCVSARVALQPHLAIGADDFVNSPQ